ncbi:GH92 family glycosyl hydrolase [Sphingomonas sp. 2R-10]|uniref:GH92 family glycosyl hydrolase n=1 Tax=Sphingomonas sp. 2R-10 TaxID=3045148 RepID=UPI000F79D8B3|nr:GH92 family glycosyl hydrolase [Sphingomonas sp. 2R-10]MDJ0275660.1 GH92 family glycosyl hydrolase [Sphingomonas sp. 2R-10]
MRWFAGAMLLALAMPAAAQEADDPVQWVDPMIGTDGDGHVFPGATLPFGMVQLSPSNTRDGWKWTSGYHYTDTVIDGFAHTHISGAGLGALGDILLMPTRVAGTAAGALDRPGTGYRSRFSHDREQAQAGYYRVHLDDADVDVELTTTLRTGFHRYRFNGAAERYVVIDPIHAVGDDHALEAGIEVVSDREIRGWRRTIGSSAGARTVYFVARFSQPFVAAQLTEGDRPVAGRQGTGAARRAYVRFANNVGQVEVAVAISHASAAGALANFRAEAEGQGFDTVRRAAQATWAKRLSAIRIDERDATKKRVFYTAGYHAAIAPNLVSDVTGDYRVEGRVLRSGIQQYSNFSNWDTYRAVHPLLTIVDPDKAGGIVASMVSRHRDAGLVLPSWEAVGHDNRVMIGYPIVSIVADAVIKGLPGVDPASAYAAIRASAFDRTKHSNVYDLNGMDGYLRYGFVPADVASSVSKTTEQNYQDWTIGQVAAKLGRTHDAALFATRATGWRQLYDPASGWLLPRLADGRFAPMRRDDWGDLNRHYVSGNIWAYSAYTPHDMAAAIRLHGGRAAFGNWLDDIFRDTTPIGGEQHVDLSGFVGRYGHGDEPGHQMPYLFNLAGQPGRTQYYVNRVLREMYSDRPGGLVNNDDLGQMSAWYVFSTLGFYPVAPGDLTYQIGAPYHRRATVTLPGGRAFVVEADGLSSRNIYVQSATLDGRPLTSSYLTHGQLLAGGTLRFVMGAKPSRWGAGVADSSLGAFDDKAPVAVTQRAPWAPYDPVDDPRFAATRDVTLRAAGGTIRYTRGAGEPTPGSTRYTAPVRIDRDTVLRAAAFDPAPGRSTTLERQYVRSLLKGAPAGFPRIAIAEDGIGYGAKDGAMLVDGIVGGPAYGDKRWTGRVGDITATIDLGSAKPARTLTIGYLDDSMNGIMPPRRIEVLAGDDPARLVPIGHRDIGPWGGVTQKVERIRIALPGRAYRYYRIRGVAWGDLPASLKPPGRPSWLFLDEINLQ